MPPYGGRDAPFDMNPRSFDSNADKWVPARSPSQFSACNSRPELLSDPSLNECCIFFGRSLVEISIQSILLDNSLFRIEKCCVRQTLRNHFTSTVIAAALRPRSEAKRGLVVLEASAILIFASALRSVPNVEF